MKKYYLPNEDPIYQPRNIYYELHFLLKDNVKKQGDLFVTFLTGEKRTFPERQGVVRAVSPGKLYLYAQHKDVKLFTLKDPSGKIIAESDPTIGKEKFKKEKPAKKELNYWQEIGLKNIKVGK
jgi:hypothetical protein